MSCRAVIPGLASALVAALLAGGVGCAGSRQPQTKPPVQIHSTVDRIEARSREDRRKILDLEHELSMLKRQLVEVEQESLALPALPVEVRAPEKGEPLPVQEAHASRAGSEEAHEAGEVVGVDDEGVEIVYVGEAARAQSVRPRPLAPSYLPSERSPDRSAEKPASASASPPTIDWQMEAARSDRIPITDRVGPKVDRLVSEMPADAPRPRPAPVAARPAPAAARPAATPPALAGRPPPAPPGKEDPKIVYARLLETLRAGDHATAIDGFRAFVARHPEHDLADNAQYWLGEAFYDQRRYRDALLEFRKVVDNHPRGNKVPDALLKIGYCHAALGEPEKARTALELVMSMFPKSKPAALAAQRIETLAQE